MQERRNSIANALELRLSCINPSITSTPYAVLPLFATRFSACTGGIWVIFIEPYLSWNLLTCFLCFCNLEFPDISFGDLLQFEHRTSLFSCLCMSMLTPKSSTKMQKHRYLGCFHAVSARENISGVWDIDILCHSFTCVQFHSKYLWYIMASSQRSMG